jgi:hypothetical protein
MDRIRRGRAAARRDSAVCGPRRKPRRTGCHWRSSPCSSLPLGHRATRSRTIRGVVSRSTLRNRSGFARRKIFTHSRSLRGRRLRSDATVVLTAIHEPTDSSLLIDYVRVLTRLLRETRECVALDFTSPTTCAGPSVGRSRSSMRPKAEQRLPLYRDLVKVVENTVDAAERNRVRGVPHDHDSRLNTSPR